MIDFYAQIFVSINHGASHWYVVVLDIPGSSVLIWDPLPSDMRKNALVGDAKKIVSKIDPRFVMYKLLKFKRFLN